MTVKLTDDALDILVDIIMMATGKIPRKIKGARRYWLDVTSDWWYEWCDRKTAAWECEEEDYAAVQA